MADEVVLLSFWPSPFGSRVKLALAEKGVEYEYKEENLLDKSSLLLQSNPVYRKIPVLIHKGKPVIESLVIVEYIDEVWNKSPSLLPHDPFQRANARFWADFVDKKIDECTTRVRRSKGEEQVAAKDEFIGYLKSLEEQLGDKSYFGGDVFGYVDIALISFSVWFYTYETVAKFSVEDESPRLMAWMKRYVERESVSKALPDPQDIYEYVNTLKKKLDMRSE